jgi:hypothetical protein
MKREIVLTIPVRVKSNRVTIVRTEQLPWSLASHPATTSVLFLFFLPFARKTCYIIEEKSNPPPDFSSDFFIFLRKEIMDSDIRENLKEVGKHLEDVGRQVSSTKSNTESIRAMRDTLILAADTLDTYLSVQRMRDDV